MRPDQGGVTLADPPTAAANDTDFLGSGESSQPTALVEQGMPRINMLDIYKQWAIGGIDTLLRVLYEASGALDIAIPYEPYQSPFAQPQDAAEATARFMGASQIPALAGLAFEGPLSIVTGAGESASDLPGQWIAVNESMSASASGYQAQITGKVGQAYIINGVKFDGISNGVLLEAKGPGYANFVQDGKFRDWFTGEKALINQAKNQAAAANGAPIQWHVADAEAVQALQKLFFDKNVTGIKIIYTPASQ